MRLEEDEAMEELAAQLGGDLGDRAAGGDDDDPPGDDGDSDATVDWLGGAGGDGGDDGDGDDDEHGKTSLELHDLVMQNGKADVVSEC